jgi:hypothetical protein
MNIASLLKSNVSHGVATIKTTHVLSTVVLTFLGSVIEACIVLIEQNWECSAQTLVKVIEKYFMRTLRAKHPCMLSEDTHANRVNCYA